MGAALIAALGLSACGDTTAEQAALGAAAGTVGSALLDGNLVTGAAVGAAANVIYCKEYQRSC
ncbi:hypothetical protein GFB49_04335 [Epibacterium sp. SM1979]|uniref:Uncharacterized protein n=1 Tax=Tritonibacter litoralis TaxID=2662264 RepID=A0A843Y9S9_9RHOB|nr:hypothetical protein [Tritonibacter litoralis]MQQ07676.1 hypothetical protein [Tritonibacter litoralis]